MLANHFYAELSATPEPLPPAVIATLMARAWPGNVRELRNDIERRISLGWSNQVEALPAPERGAVAPPPALEALVPTDLPLKEARARWTAQFELLYASALLRRTSGNVTRAAELAGVNRRSFQRMMADHGIRSDDEQWSDVPDGGEDGS